MSRFDGFRSRSRGGAAAARVASTVVLLSVLSATLCSAGANAAVIAGDPLQIFMDGSGHLQVRFQGQAEGELAPGNLDLSSASGMTFTIYTTGAAAGCGAAGNPVTPVSGPTAVTGAGTVASPYEMSTTYACNLFGANASIGVTQTFSYVNGETGFLARYVVTNPGASAVRFRAISRGVFTMGGAGMGQGFLDATAPRVVGVFNDEQGSAGGFIEIASMPWSRYVAGPARCNCTVFTNEEDSFGPGLTNTIEPSTVPEPRAAVQFDRYRSFGLEPAASDTFDIGWFFDHYGGLGLTPRSGSLTVGQEQSVTAVSRDHGQPVGGAAIRYAITGANATSGSVSTAVDGKATISWLGSQPGEDVLTAYVDNDRDGAFDEAIDTQQKATFVWTAAPAPAAPPPPPPAPPPAAAVPSNSFAVLAARADARGVITLLLRAPVAGAFRAVATSGRSAKLRHPYGIGRATAVPGRSVKLRIFPTRAGRRRITRAGLKVMVAVRFTPTGGIARTKQRAVVVGAGKAPLRARLR